MTDLLTLLALVVLVYVLAKEKDKIASSISEKINAALKGAQKFVTFVVASLGFAFVLGQLYAASFFGYFPDDFLFWLPIYVEFFLILYYYIG